MGWGGVVVDELITLSLPTCVEVELGYDSLKDQMLDNKPITIHRVIKLKLNYFLYTHLYFLNIVIHINSFNFVIETSRVNLSASLNCSKKFLYSKCTYGYEFS